MTGRGREAHPEVWKGLGGPHKGMGRVGRPTRSLWKGMRGPPDNLEAHPNLWESSEVNPKVREGSGDPHRGPG